MHLVHRPQVPFAPDRHLVPLIEPILGPDRARALADRLVWPAALAPADPEWVSASQVALALGALLFMDVQRRVPEAAAYVEAAAAAGRRLTFDHGALRTVAASSGRLPQGAAAFARLLEPLGYRRAGRYELSALGMTGYAYAHVEAPEEVPQYFVSELHPERFSARFQDAVQRVVDSSRDPLTEAARTDLVVLESEGQLPGEEAVRLLPELVACFARQHAMPTWSDYELLLAESPEMAWIATEGNAFNHATDRVEDVEAAAASQRALGLAVKEHVSVSASGRVRQTALRAALVERALLDETGAIETRLVPGSFHEFIQRGRLADGRLDLAFDAGNATSIFGMTTAEGA